MKKYISKHRAKENEVLAIFILQETKNSNLFDKNCTHENVKCHIPHEESWLRRIMIKQVNYNNRVTISSTYIFWQKLNLLTFKASLEEVIVMHAVAGRCIVKKVLSEISQNSQENICVRVSFLIKLQTWVLQLFKKETLAQMFSGEFCKIFKNIFFTKHLQWLALCILRKWKQNT